VPPSRGAEPTDFTGVAFEVEAELQKLLEDKDLLPHLRLGVLKQLIELRGRAEPVSSNGHVVMPERDDGLPCDPLLEQFPDEPDEHGHPRPNDPMADLHWEFIVGRPPHHLYARVLVRVPFDLSKRRDDEAVKVLLDAEARFVRECRNRGIEGADDVSERRVRRQRKRRSG
jgi:hypothetical protein